MHSTAGSMRVSIKQAYALAGSYGQSYSQSAMGGWRQLDDNTQWTGPSTLECASMEGRRAVIDVQHYPTALQVCHCAWQCPSDAGLKGFVSHVRGVVRVTGFFLCCHMRENRFIIKACGTLHALGAKLQALCYKVGDYGVLLY